MKELVEVIAKSLVEHPDEVVVTENEKEDAVIIELKVGPSDMGKVIGRQGRIAKAIRTVVKAASSKSSKKVMRQRQAAFLQGPPVPDGAYWQSLRSSRQTRQDVPDC